MPNSRICHSLDLESDEKVLERVLEVSFGFVLKSIERKSGVMILSKNINHQKIKKNKTRGS